MRRDTLHVGSGKPLSVLTFGKQGPAVVITAGVHGDEVTGLAVCHALIAHLQRRLVFGRVVLLPCLNVDGLIRQSRTVPGDGVDLNRAFPQGRGISGGIVRAVWSLLTDLQPEALIDLHADSGCAIPYTIVDRAVKLGPSERLSVESKSRSLARATGWTVIDEYPDESYLHHGFHHSLTGAVVNDLAVAAITLEAGPRRWVDPTAVQRTCSAVLAVLGNLAIVEHKFVENIAIPGGPWHRAPAPRSEGAGIWTPKLHPGDCFCAGEVLGTVRGLGGEVIDVIRAQSRGIVISWGEKAWLEPRSIPGTLGLLGG